MRRHHQQYYVIHKISYKFVSILSDSYQLLHPGVRVVGLFEPSNNSLRN